MPGKVSMIAVGQLPHANVVKCPQNAGFSIGLRQLKKPLALRTLTQSQPLNEDSKGLLIRLF